MGFLKFLKKRDAQEEDLLDVPPIPPTGNEETYDIPKGLDDIPPPPIDDIDSKQTLRPLSANDTENIIDNLDMPFPEPDDNTADITNNYQQSKDNLPPPIEQNEEQEIKPRKQIIKVQPAKQSTSDNPNVAAVTFVKMEQFRTILEEISAMRADIKVAEENAHATAVVSEEEEKIRTKVKTNLQEIQKKLMIVDKVLTQ